MKSIVQVIVILGVLIMLNSKAHAENSSSEATFAGGCFWCMEPPFERLEGVKDVIAGYTGGKTKDPSYEEVSSGDTGHREAVRIKYDPSRIEYDNLLDVFWKSIDPTDQYGQFSDKGTQYRTAIYYHDAEQKKKAERSKKELQASGKFKEPIATEILESSAFYKAEDYHQDYHKKKPVPYKLYKKGSGREIYLSEVWGDQPAEKEIRVRPCPEKMSIEDLKKSLSPMSYRITQEKGTEKPFDNEYWNNKREGIYVDIVSGEVLFSSKDKFESGTGWPSFTMPLEKDNIMEKEDISLFMKRTEVRSKQADSHLGHVFKDGPGPTGLRYCINSASLRFIPKETLDEEGYGEYKKIFEEK